MLGPPTFIDPIDYLIFMNMLSKSNNSLLINIVDAFNVKECVGQKILIVWYFLQ